MMYNEKKIAVIGHTGFVGRSVYKVFSERLFKRGFEIVGHSIDQPNEEGILDARYMFICVPTPLDPKTKELDISIVKEYVYNYDNPIKVIKSTIMPGTGLGNIKGVIHNPEFLSQNTAVRDFKDAKYTVIGCNNQMLSQELVTEIYNMVYGMEHKYHICNFEEAAMIKTAHNTFLAMKVGLFNMFYDICERVGVPYNSFREGVCLSPWICRTHTMITKERGYGGPCFSKDPISLEKTANKLGIDCGAVAAMEKYNSIIRTPQPGDANYKGEDK